MLWWHHLLYWPALFYITLKILFDWDSCGKWEHIYFKKYHITLSRYGIWVTKR